MNISSEYIFDNIHFEKDKLQQIKFLNLMNNILVQVNDGVRTVIEHQKSVANLSIMIGKEMGFKANKIANLYIAGMCHDIGKITVQSETLNKTTKLNLEEYEIIKKHPLNSYNIAKNLGIDSCIAFTVLQHHERINGTGYPYGLKSEEIMIESQIIAVADSIDAMLSFRPYSGKQTVEYVIDDLLNNSGVLYNEGIVKAAIMLLKAEIEK